MVKIYENILRRAAFLMDAETAHEKGLKLLEFGLKSRSMESIANKRFNVEGFGNLNRFGLTFRNPLGIAAGFDKNGKVVRQLASLGFGSVEIGTVTLNPQPGNEKPRIFRLPDDNALINRLGFNNEGAEAVSKRLKNLDVKCVLGVNIGKNKDVQIQDAVENYLSCFEKLYEPADYITVNVSSPNTPNLRELQKAESMEQLLGALQTRNKELGNGVRKPLLVKIAPDLDEAEIEAIVDVSIRLNLAGIIATNTTIKRQALITSAQSIERIGAGGLSGHPLSACSTEVIRLVRKYTKGEIAIIGVGGIFSAEDAFEKIAAGACLLQAYTGFVYKGFDFAHEINTKLLELLSLRGFTNLDDAIGSDSRR
ncbi:MAG: quinone-dependent dihydroorotate dehydrogenase [Pyrinomonadaceae bacterium]